MAVVGLAGGAAFGVRRFTIFRVFLAPFAFLWGEKRVPVFPTILFPIILPRKRTPCFSGAFTAATSFFRRCGGT